MRRSLSSPRSGRQSCTRFFPRAQRERIHSTHEKRHCGDRLRGRDRGGTPTPGKARGQIARRAFARHRARELDGVYVDPVVDADRAGRGATAEADDEDIARFGQLYLQRGQWRGRQLVPAAWIDSATSRWMSNGSNPESDWEQGYGFQFWRCRHGVYRGDGANGQFCIVFSHSLMLDPALFGRPDGLPL